MSYDAIIDINIDKTSLVNAIAQDICSRCNTSSEGVNPQLFKPISRHGSVQANNHELKWIGGWWISKNTQSNRYPKVQTHPPFVPVAILDADQAVVIGSAFYIYNLHNAWILFNERAPQYASGVLGFYLHSEGTITVEQGGGTADGTTSMDVEQGDIVLLMWIVGNLNGTLKIRFAGGHYNWNNDTWTKEIDAIEDIPSSEQQNFRYVTLHEPAGSIGTIFIGPYQYWWARAGYALSNSNSPNILDNLGYDIKILKQRGLVNPATITP